MRIQDNSSFSSNNSEYAESPPPSPGRRKSTLHSVGFPITVEILQQSAPILDPTALLVSPKVLERKISRNMDDHPPIAVEVNTMQKQIILIF